MMQGIQVQFFLRAYVIPQAVQLSSSAALKSEDAFTLELNLNESLRINDRLILSH